MTWVTDNNGTNWVETPVRKRRKSPRAIRFVNIKVGDQLMMIHVSKWTRAGKKESSQSVSYYAVTDLWFDPVKGQKNHVAGEMVAIARIGRDGSISDWKEPHTKRGLASQGFHYADRDYIVEGCALVEAVKDGSVVGIGRARVIRQRPKIPGHQL